MKPILKRGFPFWALLLLSACIREERSGCPTWLRLDLSSVPSQIEQIHLLFATETQEVIFQDTLYAGQWHQPYEIPLRKGWVLVAAFGNIRQMELQGNTYRIPTGKQADSVYTDFHRRELRHEQDQIILCPQKNFITVTLEVTGKQPDEPLPQLYFEGSADGYDLQGSVSSGQFHYRLGCRDAAKMTTQPSQTTTRHNSLYRGRIPRQKDDQLQLIVYLDPNTCYRFPIGSAMYQAGIDMSQDELPDWHFLLDLSLMTLTLETEDWIRMDPIEAIL